MFVVCNWPHLLLSAMTSRCRLALLKSREELIRDLDIKPVTDYLLSKLILHPQDSQRILARQPDHERRRRLLDVLPQKGQRAFDELCQFLARPNNQAWLHRSISANLDGITQGRIWLSFFSNKVIWIIIIYHCAQVLFYSWTFLFIYILIAELLEYGKQLQHLAGGGKLHLRYISVLTNVCSDTLLPEYSIGGVYTYDERCFNV